MSSGEWDLKADDAVKAVELTYRGVARVSRPCVEGKLVPLMCRPMGQKCRCLTNYTISRIPLTNQSLRAPGTACNYRSLLTPAADTSYALKLGLKMTIFDRNHFEQDYCMRITPPRCHHRPSPEPNLIL